MYIKKFRKEVVKLNKTSLIEDIDNTRKNINHIGVDYLFEINKIFDSLKSNYQQDLLELITALKDNQNDTNFPDLDGKAIGKYLKSKGYSKQCLETLVQYIFKSFD